MSYSFSVRAATKTEAIAKVAYELAKVVAAQPIHAADQEAAQRAADAVIEAVRDDETRDVSVNVNGSCWGGGAGLEGSSVNVSVSLGAKQIDPQVSPS